MLVIPAVDIKEGKVVRLFQGDFEKEKVYSDDPLDLARRWEGEGAEYLHLVDLDGARRGRPVNRDRVLQIREGIDIPIQVGGGVRTLEDARGYLEAGINRVIMGTAVFKGQEQFREVQRAYPGRIAVGIDADEGRVKVEGWQEGTGVYAWDLARKVEDWGGELIVFTNINRDGTMVLGEPDVDILDKFAGAVKVPVIAAGGISSVEDIKKIKDIEGRGIVAVIIGKALYEGKINLKEAIIAARQD